MLNNRFSSSEIKAASQDWTTQNTPMKKYTADINSIFGELTYNLEVMEEKLPKNVFKSLLATIDKGEPLDPTVADAVALGMKEWAIEHGATHYTHWFQPLTGTTAEKHDSFITPNKGGGAMVKFSGKELIQGEPDASSFPSGGLRATFEARGYTAWDPTSPAFIVKHHHGATLCIPTAFASWTGEALDHKTPLLRSIEALNESALEALELFDVDAAKVYSTVGTEQEYFLVDEEYYYRRPDLIATGRTLFGTQPPRGQEMDDHYFGSIPERVLAYMSDVEYQMYRQGIPVQTRHNEVAPGQYEFAPLFEHANIACDHQQMIMQTMKNTARKYGLVCLLHEKPFAGINGSGKHNNWSMSTDSGLNLLEPGDTPHSNKLFLFFCTAVIKAVHENQDLLRISCASAGNDHRLGANEAPPAIMSIFLGDQLEDVYKQLEKGTARKSKKSGLLGLGSQVLPPIPRHSGDRNRTSPFAFTGNKFEFRAVGSDQTASFTNVVLNTIAAQAIKELSAALKAALKKAKSFDKALEIVLSDTIKAHKNIIFGGDGYADAWQKEAAKRGLMNLRTSPDAFAEFNQKKNLDLFKKHNVFNRREILARQEIMFEQYSQTLTIESDCMANIARKHIMPNSVAYLKELTNTVVSAQAIGMQATGVAETAEAVNDLLTQFKSELDSLVEAKNHIPEGKVEDQAMYIRDEVIPAMQALRITGDQLEKMIPKNLWDLPSYEEMLFIK